MLLPFPLSYAMLFWQWLQERPSKHEELSSFVWLCCFFLECSAQQHCPCPHCQEHVNGGWQKSYDVENLPKEWVLQGFGHCFPDKFPDKLFWHSPVSVLITSLLGLSRQAAKEHCRVQTWPAVRSFLALNCSVILTDHKECLSLLSSSCSVITTNGTILNFAIPGQLSRHCFRRSLTQSFFWLRTWRAGSDLVKLSHHPK